MAKRMTLLPAGMFALLAGIAFAEEPVLSLQNSRAGHLVPVGEAVSVQVRHASAEHVGWRVRDWLGAVVDQGRTGLAKGKGVITIQGLPRGYYELEIPGDSATPKFAFAVVTDRSKEAPSRRLSIDGATAWLERGGRHKELAAMLRMIGIGWIRERFSWGGTEPEKGKVQWRQYDAVADAFAEHGIKVYQIFHDSPSWTHGGRKNTLNPRDLRDVYRFAKRLAKHYHGRVQAWEVWNEPDIFFWPDLGDTFAGVQKAAYLGFKAGDPGLLVLQGSFCRGYCHFDESLFEAGISDYFDIFNWHIYAPPSSYAATLGGYLKLLERYRSAGRPVWLTEAGIRLRATEPDGELNPADERKQAEFIPRSFASSLAAGTDNHFFFVYPYYLERGIQFGALRKDLSPRPGFAAMAAAVDILGEARCLGSVKGKGLEGVTALVFERRKDEFVMVLWGEDLREIKLPVDAPWITLADTVGKRKRVVAKGGSLTLKVGPAPQYVMGVGGKLASLAGGPARSEGRLTKTRPHPVVVRTQAKAPIDKNSNSYLIGEDAVAVSVEVCNLHETEHAKGRLDVQAPDTWKADPGELGFDLPPMGRMVKEVQVTPGRPAMGIHKVWVRPESVKRHPSPAVSYFQFDYSKVPPRKQLDMALNDPGRWKKNMSGNGAMTIRKGGDESVRCDIAFDRSGDRWCFPRVDFSPPADFSGYDGIRFEYRLPEDDRITKVRLQVFESSGAAYLTRSPWDARPEWTKAACFFKDLGWGSHSRPDANGKLDLKAIRTLMIGINTTRDKTCLEIRNVELMRVR